MKQKTTKRTFILIKEDIWKKLKYLKADLGVNTFNEVLDILIKNQKK